MRRAALVLLVLVLLWGGDAVWGATAYWAHDLRHHHVPWRVWAASEWLEGRVPLWCPGVGAGFPLLADGQTGALYPPAMLLFAALPPAFAVNASILTHVLWAGLGAVALARALGSGPSGSLVAGVAFAFSGFLATHGHYLGMQNAVAWLPWAAWAVAARKWSMAALAAWAMLVAGHLQAAAFGLALVVAFAAWSGVLIPCLGALALAAVAASPQLVATAELVGQSSREGGVSAAFAGIGSLPPQELVNGVLPRFFGFERPADVPATYEHKGGAYWGAGESHWEMAFYLGLPAVFLAAHGVRGRRAWAIATVVSAVLMLGANGPLWPLLRLVPGLDLLRFPVRFSLCLTLCVAVLAAAGLDRLLDAPAGVLARAGRRAALAAAVLVCGLGAGRLALEAGDASIRAALSSHFQAQVALAPSHPAPAAIVGPEAEDPAAIPAKVDRIVTDLRRSTTPWAPRVAGPAAVLLMVAALLFGAARGRLSRPALGTALAVVLALDLFAFGRGYQVRFPRSALETEPPALAAIRSDGVPGRVAVVDRRQDPVLDVLLMSANLGLPWGARDVVVPSPLMLPRNEAALALVGLDIGGSGTEQVARLSTHRRIADLLGVRWLLSVHDLAGFDPMKRGPVSLYRNPAAMPSEFLVSCVERLGDKMGGAMGALPGLDPARWAIVEEGELGVPDCRDGAGSGEVRVVARDPQGTTLEVDVDRPSLLVQTESYYPGWRAAIDGKPTRLYRADALFRGVVVPAGRHEVLIAYVPIGIRACLGLGLLGLGAIGFLALLDLRAPR